MIKFNEDVSLGNHKRPALHCANQARMDMRTVCHDPEPLVRSKAVDLSPCFVVRSVVPYDPFPIGECLSLEACPCSCEHVGRSVMDRRTYGDHDRILRASWLDNFHQEPDALVSHIVNRRHTHGTHRQCCAVKCKVCTASSGIGAIFVDNLVGTSCDWPSSTLRTLWSGIAIYATCARVTLRTLWSSIAISTRRTRRATIPLGSNITLRTLWACCAL